MATSKLGSGEFHEAAYESSSGSPFRGQRLEEGPLSISPQLPSHPSQHHRNQLLFGRTIKTKLPQLESEKHTEFDQEVKRRDELAKEKMKIYVDKKARAQLTEMRVNW